MDMKKKLSNHTKYTIAFLSVILLFLFIFQVIAQTSAPAPNPGHQASSVSIDYTGSPDNVQTAIDDLDNRIGAGGGGGGSGGTLQTISGIVNIEFVDLSGPIFGCYFTVDINGQRVFPDPGVTCTSSNFQNCEKTYILQSIPYTSTMCHSQIQGVLREKLDLPIVTNLAQKHLSHIAISNYDPTVSGTTSSQSYDDATFDIDYITSPPSGEYRLNCPSSCTTYGAVPGTCTPASTDLYTFDYCCNPPPSTDIGCWPDYIPL